MGYMISSDNILDTMDDNSLNHMVLHILQKFDMTTLPSKKFYKGTTITDKLAIQPEFKFHFWQIKPWGMICNTIASKLAPYAMGHWVAITLHFMPLQNCVTVRYFDSFGESPNKCKYIKQYIDNIRRLCQQRNITFNLDVMSYGIQYFSSNQL